MGVTGKDSDDQLVEAARYGDRAALSLLVERHRPLLLSMCRRMTGDMQAAEDAAQEAVLQALLHLDRLRRPERFGQWLFGIGLNVCRVALRRRSADAWSLDAVIGGRTEPELYIVLLEEESGGKRLPIWVGPAEGTFIATQIENLNAARPLTLVFAAELLGACRARLRECLIARLAESTFYATAVIEAPDGVKEVDARPSDAIGLALVTGAPLFVASEVFTAAEADLQRQHGAGEDVDVQCQLLEDAASIVAEVRERWGAELKKR